jgi:hypothetical protein
VSRDLSPRFEVERYRPLGLLANPFLLAEHRSEFNGTDIETAAEADKVIAALLTASEEAAPKPITVLKADGLPSAYFMRAAGLVQRSLASDETLNVAFSYVALFMMRLGRVRSIISVLAERLVFRDFDLTLSLYIERLLAEHDTELVAYQLLGEEAFDAFVQRFRSDPLGVTKELFGEERLERHPELRAMGDSRFRDLQSDVEEDDAAPEIDNTIGDAPANAILLAEQAEFAEEDEAAQLEQHIVDYIVEYTKVHVSPVIARALRVYRERGQVAAAAELKITKAPKKTLLALVKFALYRFKKVALVFDGFEAWYGVPPELKSQIAATLSEVRWALDGSAVMVLLLEEGRVPELEEQFGGAGTKINWAFPSLSAVLDAPDLLDRDIVNGWLERAAYPGAKAPQLDDAVLGRIFEASSTLQDFALKAATAIESAADRALSALDEQSFEEAMSAKPMEANE